MVAKNAARLRTARRQEPAAMGLETSPSGSATPFLAAGSLGESIIPAINKLQDVFSQVGAASSSAAAPPFHEEPSWLAPLLRREMRCLRTHVNTFAPPPPAAVLGGEAGPAADRGGGLPVQRQVIGAGGAGGPRLPASRLQRRHSPPAHSPAGQNGGRPGGTGTVHRVGRVSPPARQAHLRL